MHLSIITLHKLVVELILVIFCQFFRTLPHICMHFCALLLLARTYAHSFPPTPTHRRSLLRVLMYKNIDRRITKAMDFI